MNKKEDGIRIYGSPKRLGYTIYQLLTKRDIGKIKEVSK